MQARRLRGPGKLGEESGDEMSVLVKWLRSGRFISVR